MFRFKSVCNLCLLILAICCSGCPGDAPKTGESQSNPAADPAPTSAEEPAFDSWTLEKDFRLLTLADFAHFPADATTWTEQNGVLICSGQPKGYAYTHDDFANFTLRCEFKYVPEGTPPDAETSLKFNTGFMLYIQEPHKVWPRSLEVQGRFDEMASIKSNGGVPALETVDDAGARESARLPVGQWNAVEIVSRNGELSSTLNGLVIATSKAGELTGGKFGLQSEGFEVRFKHLRIRIDP